MTISVNYARGTGGYTFSAAELARLQTLQSQLQAAMNPASGHQYDVGLGGDVYSAILEMISVRINDTFARKAGVDAAVWTWVNGAINVNAAEGFYADFIRDYTADQFAIRGLTAGVTPQQLNQLASNNIALNLVTDILAHGNLPGISGLGAIDAGAAASGVFTHDGVQEYAPWAGTLLFPYLGYPNFYTDLLLNDQQVVATIPDISSPGGTQTLTIKYATGTYDLVAALQATRMAAISAGLANPWEALGNLFQGPTGVPAPNQGGMLAATTNWFNRYYDLPAGTFNVGADTVFATGLQAALAEYAYVAGTYGGDSIGAPGSGAVVMNGGLGDDVATGSDNGDLIDGDQGNDTLLGGGGNDHLFGGAGTDRLEGGGGDDRLTGGKGSDTLVGGTGSDLFIFKSGDGPDTIVDQEGKDRIMFDGRIIAGLLIKDESSGQYAFVEDPSRTLQFNSPGVLTLDAETQITFEEQSSAEDLDGKFGLRLYEETEAASEFDRTILGDLKPVDFDPAASGVQTQVDDLGNVITNPDQPDPDRQDYLQDSAGSDDIRGFGGFDYIEAWRGGNDRLDGGAGHDIVLGREGDDLVIGGSGEDLLRGDAGEDTIHGEEEATLEDALAALDTEGTGLRGDFIDGGDDDDLVVGGAGNDALNGGQGDDLILGGGGNDDIDGDLETSLVTMAWSVTRTVTTEADGGTIYFSTYNNVDFTAPTAGGNDVIFAGAGVDWVRGGFGDDYIDGDAGDDVLFGGADHDALFGSDGADLLVGDGSNVPDALQGDDYLDGGAGEDELNGGGGNDVLFGGADNDKLYADAGASSAGEDYLDGEDGDDDLVGGAKSDQLFGGAGNDRMQGDDGTGEDDGDDFLSGEDGEDLLIGEGGDDVLDGGADNDLIAGGSGDDYLAGGAGDDQLQGGEDDDIVAGDEGSDVLFGEDGNDGLYGGDGDDFLLGGQGDDILVGGLGNDVYYYAMGEGSDVLVDEGGTDWLVLQDILWGQVTLGVGSLELNLPGGGEIHIEGFDPDNPFAAGGIEYFQFADNTVMTKTQLINALGFAPTGTPEADDLSGTALGETIHALAGDDLVTARGGNDVVFAQEGADEVRAGDGNDTVHGGDGDDRLYGQAGDDQLHGGTGNDLLAGGTGNDQLAGGEGDDTYLFEAGGGQDTATDAAGSNGILLGEGLTLDTVVFSRQGDDLVVAVRNAGDRLTVEDWFASGSAFATVTLGDGTVLDHDGVDGAMPSNQPPSVVSDEVAVQEDLVQAASGNALANDSDPEGRMLGIANPGSYAGSFGTLLLQVDGGFSYTLNNLSAAVQGLGAGQSATDVFTYTASDEDPAGAATAEGTIVVTVHGTNDLPVLGADSATTEEDAAPINGNVLANDHDVDAGTLLAIASPGLYAGSYGTLGLAADGGWTYTLANASPAVQALSAGQTVTEIFTFAVDDGHSQTGASLAIAIAGRNDIPVLAIPLADQSAAANTQWQWQLPAGSFTDADAADQLGYSATLADGGALPSWLLFDAASQTFSGRVPKSATGSIDIQVAASDGSGATVSDVFTLTFGAGSGGGGGGGGGGGSQGNAGVGNGPDGPPPGHDHDFNDGPGTGPGHPGAQGGNGYLAPGYDQIAALLFNPAGGGFAHGNGQGSGAAHGLVHAPGQLKKLFEPGVSVSETGDPQQAQQSQELNLDVGIVGIAWIDNYWEQT